MAADAGKREVRVHMHPMPGSSCKHGGFVVNLSAGSGGMRVQRQRSGIGNEPEVCHEASWCSECGTLVLVKREQ